MIMHVDMDAFFASVEQRVNPGIRGKPVIVGGRKNKYRSIVIAASYEAKALGIRVGMGSWEALRLCPQVCFVPADTAKYVSTSQGILEILRSYSPEVEQYSIDEFFLNPVRSERALGSAEDVGRRIKADIKKAFGLNCSVGIAPTWITAKLATKLGKPDGLVILDKKKARGVMEYLAVENLCGVGPRLQRRLNRLGIETCGQLSCYPDQVLREQFGVTGLWLKSACLVEEVGSIGVFKKKSSSRKSFGHSQTLREVSYDEEFIRAWIYLLSEMVGSRLRQNKLQGRTICFYMAEGFERGWAKRKTFEQATYDGQEIYRRCLSIISLLRLPCLCVRMLGVSVCGLSKADNRYLFESQKRRERLMHSLDNINKKYGEWTIFPAFVTRGRAGPNVL